MSRRDSVVIVVGSLHYDIMLSAPHLPALGETVMGRNWQPKFGGKGGNQAVAASAAGANVRMVGRVGDDPQGQFLLDQLRTKGLLSQFIAIDPKHGSGMSVAISEETGDYGAIVVSGANRHFAPEQFDAQGLWNDAYMILLQNEIPEQINLSAARRAKDLGAQVCLNAAPAREISDELAEQVDIIIVNALEAEFYAGHRVSDLSSALTASNELSLRFETCIVTAGHHGVAITNSADGDFAVPAVETELVSTHGAGDVFAGTFCAQVAAGHSTRQAVESANRMAGEHVSRPPTLRETRP